MAFGDLLKKAANKGLEIVGDAVEKGKQMAEDQGIIQKPKTPEELEAQRIATENKLQEEMAAKELERQNEIKKALQPTCEKGDCLWYSSSFYFTCPFECPCERKKYTKKDWGSQTIRPEFWPYLKRLEKREGYSPNTNEIENDFMKEFLPQYGVENSKLAFIFIKSGLVDDNPFLPIFFALKDAPKVEGDIISNLEWLDIEYGFEARIGKLGPVFENKIWTNLSLYDRSLEDFQYTVKVIMTVLNEDALMGYFKDISNISIEQLYDANGRVKPAGCGGPKAGFYGETIWNTVESWSGENGENNLD